MVRGGLGLVLLLAVVDGVFGERGLLANVQLRQRNARQQIAIDDLTLRNDGLTDEIRRLREDPSAIEELAREELGLIKDGELLIIMRDTPATLAPARRQMPARAGPPRVDRSARAWYSSQVVRGASLPPSHSDAGWSSLVARWAHNPKVAGSNPAPATTQTREKSRVLCFWGSPLLGPHLTAI